MQFGSLVLLWLLAPAFVAWAAWGVLNERRRVPLRFSNLAPLRGLAPGWTVHARTWVRRSRGLTVALLMLALLRPQTGRRQSQVWSQGVDIMLALDTSGSMKALDLDSELPITQRRNRLKVVKDVVAKFVARREADQIGMVVFGAEAFTQCPLTLDHGVVATLLDKVESGMAGDTTAIGSGIAAAVKRLAKSQARSKVVILLTDGSNNAGQLSPHKAAEVAKAFGIKVYTIGAGTRGLAPFVEDSIFGKQVHQYKLDIDEPTLQDIADVTGGAYFRAEDTKGLAGIYDQIDHMERTDIQVKQYMEYDENFARFVWPAVALLMVEVVLLGTRLRRVP